MKKNVMTITKIYERNNERNYYFTVDNKAFKWFFNSLESAEEFVKNNDSVYDYKELEVDWLLD